ncbi:hypothetical protein E4U49_008180 [Claviceps purpurea]|nr:hypothetical protein E4U49_008180 [Claviceps purpurea]
MGGNGNWDPFYFRHEDMKSTVKHIHVYAHIYETNYGNQANHWVVYLEISPIHSVRLDMSPGLGDDAVRGRLSISTKNCTYTNNMLHHFAFQTRGEPTVEDFVKLINANGLQRYDFTPEFEGCAFWVYILIAYLEQAHFVAVGSAARTKESVSYFYIYPVGQLRQELIRGIFRAPP